ncbi:MAG TPA: hypothetical protein VFK58_04330 [Sphingomicrobium sp.]|nr:hypothetical protein [Sphingomicrobium sp.]
MKTMTIRCRRWTGTVLFISLAACQQSPQSSQPTANDLGAAAQLPGAGAVKAAIEPFEMIAEQAFSASPAELATMIARAQASYRAAEPALTPQQRTAAAVQLKSLTAADGKASRTATALASIELYRQLLEAQHQPHDPAVMAGLLDYAGFRYQALVQAEQVDWQALFRTTVFAKGEWRRLSPLIDDASLRDRFAASVDAMANAAAVRDRPAALKAAASELELVDQLEKNLASAPRRAAP